MRRSIRAENDTMGDLLVLADRRANRGRGARSALTPAGESLAASPVTFCFDPACPFSYLVAERVERRFAAVTWVPVRAASLNRDRPWTDAAVAAEVRAAAERRAAQLRIPLVWPDRFPSTGLAVLRVAAYAACAGVGAAFALAACRLAFCGGYDLEDPFNLVEAAAAAGIEIEECLRAAIDPDNDRPLEAAARGLLAQGVTTLPAFKIGNRWFAGESRLAEAAAFARAPVVALRPA
jgi:2-hydroxychromene-2-carboxylate isomerase